jgi:DNA-binding CsgD family transcriptional regulator
MAITRLGDPDGQALPEVLVINADRPVAAAMALHLCAFPAMAGSVAPRGRIMGFLSPISHRTSAQVSAYVLKATFALTPVEALVVLGLRRHMEPGQVALELNLAISTVRSHLKHIFRKTSTTRQSELLRLVDCVLAAVHPSVADNGRDESFGG